MGGGCTERGGYVICSFLSFLVGWYGKKYKRGNWVGGLFASLSTMKYIYIYILSHVWWIHGMIL